MEEDKGLDLSLGLPLGGSSSKSKDKNDNLADTRTDDGDRTSKIVNDFRNFLNGGNPQQDPSIFHRIDSVKPQDNLFRDVSPSYVHMSLPRPHDIGVVCSGPSFNVSLAFVEGDASFNENERRLSITGSKRSTEGEDEKGPVVGEKRKILLDEANHLKKQETETRNSDLHDKPKMSHISITTDDGFMADNEDVAESEAEGSTSRLVSHFEEGSKWHVEGGSSFEVPKEIHGKPMILAPPYTASSLIVPYSISIKETASVGVTSTSSFPSAGMMQAMPSINIECSSTQTLSAGNVPAIFGYSLVQLPTFDKDNGWGMAADSLSFNPSYAATGISTSAAMQVNHNLSEAVPPSELAKSNGKQATEEGSSSHTGDEALGSGILMGGKTSEVPAGKSGNQNSCCSEDAEGAKNKRKRKEFAPFGNYRNYYGYRVGRDIEEDPRFKLLKKDWFEGKNCLDIGCNNGLITISIARKFRCHTILGIDIDRDRIEDARWNLRKIVKKESATKGYTSKVKFVEVASGLDHVESLCKNEDQMRGKTYHSSEERSLPDIVSFRCENFIENCRPSLVEHYDTIVCLSVTKWVQLNWGDEGLIKLFAKIWRLLHPGGILVLEPQPWKSYCSKRLVTETSAINFGEIKLYPKCFQEILVDKIGFRTVEIATSNLSSTAAGFNRPILVFSK